MRWRAVLPAFLIGLAALSCSRKDPGFDAMGNFEAEEYLVAPELPGRLVYLPFREGDRIRKGDTVAVTDTLTIGLQRKQLIAQREAMEAKVPGIRAQERVVDAEIASLRSEKERFQKLFSERAATGKTVDDINNQLNISLARKGTFATQISGIRMEQQVLDAQIRLLDDQIRKSFIHSPAGGTLINLLSKPLDIASPGRPILKIAEMDLVNLKAYVTEDQLSKVRIGDKVKIRIDAPDGGFLEYTGEVYWIADQAEFTPKVIQTRKERVNLVYAIKARVQNDGKIKIGMPGELVFTNE